MPMNPRKLVLGVAAALVLSCTAGAQTPPAQAPTAASAPAGDPAKGRENTRMCEGCHGIAGWHTAYPEVYHVPRLGGQHEAYIVSALKQYRSGERSHPSMRAIAAALSDEDIANLAAYYARSQTTTTASQ